MPLNSIARTTMPIQHRIQQQLEIDPTGIAKICSEMITVPAFVYNFVEDRYLCVSKSVNHFLPINEITGKGMYRWIDRVHPEDFQTFVEAYRHDMNRLSKHRKTDSPIGLKTVAIRIANIDLEWIPTIIKSDVVGYDVHGNANCIFGLLLTEESIGKADENLLGNNDWQALQAIRDKHFRKSQPNTINISVREWEVLNLLREGMTTRQIAAHLFISMHTVESHRKNLLQKFSCHTSVELVAKAGAYYHWHSQPE
jgi:DNA-binding CsgD family transcriptional regulator